MRGFAKSLVIVVAEFDRVGVSARFEHNEILLGQTLVDVGGQAVEITERRHGSHRAIWKERCEFVFGLQDSRLAGDFLDLLKIDSMVCGRRLTQAGSPVHYSPHSFRATGITNYLENGGTLEVAQRIAGHALRFANGVDFSLKLSPLALTQESWPPWAGGVQRPGRS